MEIKYRTEAFSGSGVRDAKEVILHEILELENTDVLETLRNGLLDGTELADRAEAIMMKVQGVTRAEVTDAEVTAFCDDALDIIRKKRAVNQICFVADQQGKPAGNLLALGQRSISR